MLAAKYEKISFFYNLFGLLDHNDEEGSEGYGKRNICNTVQGCSQIQGALSCVPHDMASVQAGEEMMLCRRRGCLMRPCLDADDDTADTAASPMKC
jgi:hypothetical protein